MTAIISLTGLTALLIITFWLYNDYRVDRHRQALFGLRDELFDAALRGEISFGSETYRITRAMLNGMIRYTHKTSIIGLFIALGSPRREHPISKKIDRVFAKATDAERQLCQRTLQQAHLETAKHLASSPFMHLLIVPALLTAAGVVTAHTLVHWLQRQFRILDASAYCEATAP